MLRVHAAILSDGYMIWQVSFFVCYIQLVACSLVRVCETIRDD